MCEAAESKIVLIINKNEIKRFNIRKLSFELINKLLKGSCGILELNSAWQNDLVILYNQCAYLMDREQGLNVIDSSTGNMINLPGTTIICCKSSGSELEGLIFEDPIVEEIEKHFNANDLTITAVPSSSIELFKNTKDNTDAYYLASLYSSGRVHGYLEIVNKY